MLVEPAVAVESRGAVTTPNCGVDVIGATTGFVGGGGGEGGEGEIIEYDAVALVDVLRRVLPNAVVA